MAQHSRTVAWTAFKLTVTAQSHALDYGKEGLRRLCIKLECIHYHAELAKTTIETAFQKLIPLKPVPFQTPGVLIL
jgi:hypothetical protein